MLAATSAIAAVQGSAAGGGLLVLLLAEHPKKKTMHLKMCAQLLLTLMVFLLFPVSAVVQCCS